MSIKNFFKGILARGIFFRWSSGPMFDPTYQERTDAVEDLVKQETKKQEAKNGIFRDVKTKD